MSKFKKLLELAKKKQVRVHFRSRTGNYAGLYEYDTDKITISLDQKSHRGRLYTLAHELGHAYYLHGRDFYADDIAYDNLLREEVEAWNYASRLARRYGFWNQYFKRHRDRSVFASSLALSRVYARKGRTNS